MTQIRVQHLRIRVKGGDGQRCGRQPRRICRAANQPRPRPNPTANGFGGDLHARHYHDHTRLAHEFGHTHPGLRRDAERVFDRLNPDYGLPADQRSVFGCQAVRDREATLALGVRVAVHDSRQNDRNPVIWQAGQDYRAADAIHAARHQPTRARWGRSGSAPNAESARARSTRDGSGQPHHHRRQPGRRPRAALHLERHRRRQPAGGGDPEVQQDGPWRDGDTSFLPVNVWRV
jgi:Single-strand binding protein family